MKKTNLPHKTCTVCKLEFSWRKKWKKCWHEVKYCSQKCRRSTKKGTHKQCIDKVSKT